MSSRKSKNTKHFSLPTEDPDCEQMSGPGPGLVSGVNCPSCGVPFDRSQNRCLIDSCGHERCFTCIFRTQSQGCPLCLLNLTGSSSRLDSSPTKLSRVATSAKPSSTGSNSNSNSLQRGFSLTKSFSSVLFDRSSIGSASLSASGTAATSSKNLKSASICEREVSNTSHESGFFSAGNLTHGEINQTFPRRRKNASRTSLLGPPSLEHPNEAAMSGGSSETNTVLSSSQKSEIIKHFSNTTSVYVKSQIPQQGFLPIKPLYFEIPRASYSSQTAAVNAGSSFVGRQWIFREIHQHLSSHLPTNKGVIIRGGPGTGKTELVVNLVENSFFGRNFKGTATTTTSMVGGARLSTSLSSTSLLSNCLVGYHFCQSDNSPTCHVPEFVHSLAAQLSQCPQLSSYHHVLQSDINILNHLSWTACNINPHQSLNKGILEPLTELERSGKISVGMSIIAIDGLCEAEHHRPDYGDTMATFLAKHIGNFPPWLKIVATVRTSLGETLHNLPFHQISLDNTEVDERLNKDVADYVSSRIYASHNITTNTWRKNFQTEAQTVEKLTKFLTIKAKGCLLYVKLILDFIERGILNLKSSSFKSLPQSLSEIYHLAFNLQFPTGQSYEQISQILSIALVQLQPVNLDTLYTIFSALHVKPEMKWNDFQDKYQLISDFLVTRNDGTLMFSHSTLREWLVGRRDGESTKFLCDPKLGHAASAYYISRQPGKILKSDSVLGLIHHLLKANVNKITETDSSYANKEIQAAFISLAVCDVSEPLAAIKNIYSPIIKVSRLLLLAGADPNQTTDQENQCPLLGVHSRLGHTDMVSLLLEYGADPNACNSSGVSPLSLASGSGHLDIVNLLIQCGANLHKHDNDGVTAVVAAAKAGCLNVVEHLLIIAQDWNKVTRSKKMTLEDTAQQAFTASISSGHLEVSEFLYRLPSVNINIADSITGMTPLVASVVSTDRRMVEWVIRHKATLDPVALHAASSVGNMGVLQCLLVNGADVHQKDERGRSVLMISSAGGHTDMVESLMNAGAALEDNDNEGLTPLTHAIINNQIETASVLLQKGANVNSADSSGRSPLDVAIYQGSAEMVEMLLDGGANMEKLDDKGVRPLDRVIGFSNAAVVTIFLRKGAKLGPGTWIMAAEKPEIQLILLNKLLEDGNMLYRKCQLSDAAHRYRYALKRIPDQDNEEFADQFCQLQLHLLLNLSRCERRSGHFHEAAHFATQALTVMPSCVEGYIARAKANQAAGKMKEALFDFYHALEITPTSKEIRKAITKLKQEVGSENQLVRFGSAESLATKTYEEDALDVFSKYSSKS